MSFFSILPHNYLAKPCCEDRLLQRWNKYFFLNNRLAAAKSLQSCPTLWDPIDGSPPGSLFLGLLQERTLEWVAIFFSNAWKWKVKVKSLSPVWLLATPWTSAYQAPQSMGFSRQEYWSGVPLPSPQERLDASLFQVHHSHFDQLRMGSLELHYEWNVVAWTSCLLSQVVMCSVSAVTLPHSGADW